MTTPDAFDDRPLDWSHLRRLWPFARPYRGAFVLALLILLASWGL